MANRRLTDEEAQRALEDFRRQADEEAVTDRVRLRMFQDAHENLDEFARLLGATIVERWMFTFRRRNGGCQTFGPYATVDEAKDAFQWRYGYWPDEPLMTEEY